MSLKSIVSVLSDCSPDNLGVLLQEILSDHCRKTYFGRSGVLEKT